MLGEVTGQAGGVAAAPLHPDPANPTPRLHPGDQLHIAGGISPELVGSQEAACAIHHRPDMGIPMRVYPAEHINPIGVSLLCHVHCLSSAA